MPTPTPTAALPELTLIVAATQQMGIGRGGTLPWTGLKREMAYFARVTKRAPPLPPPPPHSQSPGLNPNPVLQNAVIMGRKTWESIPERFRPLPGRLNVVISRSAGGAGPSAAFQSSLPTSSTPTGGPVGAAAGAEGEGKANPGVIMARSLEEALGYLKKEEEAARLGRVFVIGGAQVYGAALGAKQARRVLLTRVRSEFECDTFFPVRLDDDEGGEKGWKRSGQEEMDRWVGEAVPRGWQSEAGTEYVFEMWERTD